MSKNYLIYPCKVMRITQNYKGKTSHLPHTQGTPADYPVDDGCSDRGRDMFYCPCDEMKIRRIYGVGTGGTNTIWLESTKKVCFADGTEDYCTLLIIHPDDSDLKKLSVGQCFRRKEAICREGKDGATAYHFHISAGKGRFSGNGWKKNSKGKYVLTTTKKAYPPEKLFFIDKAFTRVSSEGGLSFRELPEAYAKGTYTVNTAVLNIRKGPSTAYGKKGVLFKGKRVSIKQISDNWGKIADSSWICLDYCRREEK